MHQMAPTRICGDNIKLQLTPHLSTPKGWRLSWLTYSGRFSHISGHPSAAGRTHDKESSPVKDRCCPTVPRKQPLSHFPSWRADGASVTSIQQQTRDGVVLLQQHNQNSVQSNCKTIHFLIAHNGNCHHQFTRLSIKFIILMSYEDTV